LKINTLQKYIGIPYKHLGRGVKGLDCWGLLCLFYQQEKGIELPSYVDEYDGRASIAKAINDNLGTWQWTDKPQFGDLMVFNILGLPIHTAIYLGCGNFLHSFQNTNSCIERINSISWQRRLKGYYRWAKT